MGQASLITAVAYSQPLFLARTGNRLAWLEQFAHGRELDQLMWQASKIELARPGKGEQLEAGHMSGFDSSKPVFHLP